MHHPRTTRRRAPDSLKPPKRGGSLGHLVRPAAVAAVLCLASSCGRGAPGAAEAPSSPAPVPVASPTYPSPSPSASALPPSTGEQRLPVPTAPATQAGEIAIDRTLIPEDTAGSSLERATMNGITYPNVLTMQTGCRPAKVEINAGRVRHRFIAALGIPDNQSSASAVQVDISVDNAAPVLSTTIRFGELKDVDIDITGGLRVRVSVSSMAASCNTVIMGLGNPRFG